MSTHDAQSRRFVPWWVLVLALLLAAIEPATHLWIRYAPPEGAAPTGLRTIDSAFYLTSMRMLPSGFESPYATCKSPFGTHSIRYFTPPAYWLYGFLGVAGRGIGMSDFTALGFGNGLGALCYLLAVYGFLRQAAPKHADLAYVLFALGGGLGGVLYVGTAMAGLQGAPGFEDHFRRFALYELMEGPGLWPVLHDARLYYTASLAFCFGGLAAFIKAVRTRCSRHLAFSVFLLFFGTFFNMRYGAFALVIAGLWLVCNINGLVEKGLRALGTLTLAVVAGIVLSWFLIQASPTLGANTRQTVRQSMWLTPFITAGFFHVILASFESGRVVRNLSGPPRTLAWMGLGYLAAFGILFVAHQTYYGNWLISRDGPVADVISDWALLGAAAGALYALLRKKKGQMPTPPSLGWVTLWVLVFVSGAVSAFAQGRYGLLAPQRLVVFLGVPLAILSAATLQRISAHTPRVAYGLTGAMLFCGVCSVSVGALFFQGPLNHEPGQGPYEECHIELMSRADEAVLEQLSEGTALAPPPFGDIIAQRPGIRSIYGRGMMHADQLFDAMTSEVNTFFSPDASDAWRREFMDEWCVQYIFCPDTWPLEPEVVESLRAAPCLEEVAAQGQAVLFRTR